MNLKTLVWCAEIHADKISLHTKYSFKQSQTLKLLPRSLLAEQLTMFYEQPFKHDKIIVHLTLLRHYLNKKIESVLGFVKCFFPVKYKAIIFSSLACDYTFLSPDPGGSMS